MLTSELVLMMHNLVLNTLQVLEEESVVARGSIFWILPWWTHYRGSYSLQFGMQSVDFGARLCLKGKMMECSWFPAMDRVARESASR